MRWVASWRKLTARVDPWLLAALALAVSLEALNLWWLHRYRSGFPFDVDESGYIAFALKLDDLLGSGGLGSAWNAVQDQHGFAPLLPVTTVPFLRLFGASASSALAASTTFVILLVLAAYGIGRRLSDGFGGFLTALAVAATPGIIEYSRTYQFALASAALFCACTCALLYSDGLKRRGWALAWGATLGLGTLMRTMMVAFVPGQLGAAAWLLWATPGKQRRGRLVNLLGALSLGVIVAATWYASSLGDVFDYLTGSGYGGAVPDSGAGSFPSLSWWTLEAGEATTRELFLPLTAAIVAAAALSLAAARRSLVRSDGPTAAALLASIRGSAWGRGAVAVALILLECYLALSSSSNQGTGFRLPLVAPLLALVVLAARRLPWPRARAGLVVALVLSSAIAVVNTAGIDSSTSGSARVWLPGAGSIPFTRGAGYIQALVRDEIDSVRAQRGLPKLALSPAEPPAKGERRWLYAYDRMTDACLRRARSRGERPTIWMAVNESMLFNSSLTLSARRLGEDLRDPQLLIGEASKRVYRDALAGYLPPANCVLTVSFPVGDFIPPANQRRVEAAAKSLGFQRMASFRLPDTRSVYLYGPPRQGVPPSKARSSAP